MKQTADDLATAGVKFDADKPPLHLVDRTATENLAKVLGFGAKKYQPNNWRKGISQSRLIGAALRHLLAHGDGEDLDPESGLPHVDHAQACLMMLSNLRATRPELDDRHRGPPAAALAGKALEAGPCTTHPTYSPT